MFNIYATDYAPVDPITPPCDIVPIFIGYKGENKARCLVFDLTECVSTFGDGSFVISCIRQGDELPYLVTNTDRLDNNAIWIINSTDTAVDGYGMVQLQYIVDDVICKSALYRTVTFDSNGITGDVPDPYEDLLAQIAAYAATAEGAATTATAAANTATTAVENGIVTERSQRIAADNSLQQQITNLMGLAGAPVMANTAAAMTDSSKIYVYTGSEAGYVFGNWYYYNGAEWVSGGVYQASAVQTDPTLSVEGMAADAAACGDLKSQIYSAFVEESASGSIASFTDGADDVPLKDLIVNITPVQAGSGDPSPSNVRAISGWDSVRIARCGKNLIVFDMLDLPSSGFIIKNLDGIEISSSSSRYAHGYIPVKPNTAYTFRGLYTSATGSAYMYEYNEAKEWVKKTSLGAISTAESTYTVTTSANTYFIQIQFVATSANPSTWSLVEGNDTDFYQQGDVYPISLSSAGTVYGGTLDVTSGMLTVTHQMVTYNSSTDWTYRGGDSRYVGMFSNSNAPQYDPTDATEFKANMYSVVSVGGIGSAMYSEFSYYNGSGSYVFYLKPENGTITSLAALNTFLAANPLQVVYPLAQPISYQLTPTEVRTLLANNNIWSDTGSVESCEYRADTQLYIEKLTHPDSDMVADANITSGSYFMVGNNLYLATANIANGGAIIPGTNCTATNLAAALNAVNS